MSFHIGDTVIHCSFGLGKISKIEKKVINGHPTKSYVVRIADMTIWVPIDDDRQNSLRLPTSAEEFEKVLPILSGPSETLLEDRLLRKQQLMDQMSDGKLSSICRVIRDLSNFKRNTKLNDQEKSILEKAVNTLLAEWCLSLGVPQSQAHQTMENLLIN